MGNAEEKSHSEERYQYLPPLTYAITFIAFILAAFYYFSYDAGKTALVFTYCSIMALLSLFVRDPVKYHRIRCNYLFVHFFIGVAGGMYFSGGINAPVTGWMCLIPLLSFIVGKKEDSLIWGIICCLSIVVFILFEYTDYKLPTEILASQIEELNFITRLGLVIVAALLGFLIEINRERLWKEKESLRELSFSQSKLVSLGELAAGIAHEINNPLMIINGRIIRIKREFSKILKNEALSEGERLIVDFDKMDSDLDGVKNTVLRIHKIINSLKKLSGKYDMHSNNEDNDLNVCEMIRDVVNISLEKMKTSGIKFDWDNKLEDSLIIKGDFTQLSQVLVNLITNSIDSVLSYEDEKRHWVKLKTYLDDKKICIKVIDGGDGIPDEVRDKIFQPFFTTKEVGKGTGIGLSLSKKIVENHFGTLEIIENKNTTFLVSIPTGVQTLNEVNKEAA